MASVPPDSVAPGFPFDVNQFVSLMARFSQGPEQALHAYRELLGLESASRERSVELMAQLARAYGWEAALAFEAVLRFGPTDTARIAAAAYLADRGREETVLEVLESLQPPMLTKTLLTGLVDVLADRPATPERVERLIAFGNRFDDDTRYATLLLGDFSGVDVKRAVRRAVAESLLRRHASGIAAWPRE